MAETFCLETNNFYNPRLPIPPPPHKYEGESVECMPLSAYGLSTSCLPRLSFENQIKYMAANSQFYEPIKLRVFYVEFHLYTFV